MRTMPLTALVMRIYPAGLHRTDLIEARLIAPIAPVERPAVAQASTER